MTPTEARRLAVRIAESWNQKLTRTQLDIWAHHLEQLDHDPVLEALEQLERTSRWIPTIAELHEATAAAARRRTIAYDADSRADRRDDPYRAPAPTGHAQHWFRAARRALAEGRSRRQPPENA
jgi:hypothetical protein